MPVTRATAITEIRDNLNELTARQWSDDQLRRWVNQALREISRKVKANEVTEDIATVVNKEEYTLPATVIQINRVEYFENANDTVWVLEPRDFNGMDTVGWASHQYNSSYRPFVYTVWGYAPAAKLIVFPKPDITGATLRVYFYKLATELTISAGADTSILDIPEGWADVVNDYVEYKALRKMRDPRWQESKQLFEQKIIEMQETALRHHDQVQLITPYGTSGGWGGGWFGGWDW